MAVELIPSVLATTTPQLRRRLQVAQRLSPVIHVDLMDGRFVRRRSVSLRSWQRQALRSRLEIHAMVKDVSAIMDDLLKLQPRRVYVHVELGRRLRPIMAALRSHHVRIGVAINPGTATSAVVPYLAAADTILVMSVHPGRYGAPFLPRMVQRIAQLHRRYPTKTIACDGGMNVETIPRVIQAGAQRIIVGSDVVLNRHPQLAWRRDRGLTKKPK